MRQSVNITTHSNIRGKLQKHISQVCAPASEMHKPGLLYTKHKLLTSHFQNQVEYGNTSLPKKYLRKLVEARVEVIG